VVVAVVLVLQDQLHLMMELEVLVALVQFLQ
jgi:hypothetical protein